MRETGQMYCYVKKAINNMSYIFEKVYKHTQKQLDGHISKCELCLGW